MTLPGHRFAFGLLITVLFGWVVIMGFLMRQSALPPQATGLMLVVFQPGNSPQDILEKVTRAGAKPVRETAFGFIWVVAGDEPNLVERLSKAGAIGAYRELPINATIAGCFAYADAKVTSWNGS